MGKGKQGKCRKNDLEEPVGTLCLAPHTKVQRSERATSSLNITHMHAQTGTKVGRFDFPFLSFFWLVHVLNIQFRLSFPLSLLLLVIIWNSLIFLFFVSL